VNQEHRRLAAIMFTDIVGYSALTQENEALALDLLEEHRRLLRSLFPKHDGQEIKTIADAFLVEFASAVEAVRCAIEIQKTVVEHNTSCPPERRFEIRIGIHVGDVVHRENDVLGDGVNIASRVEPLAEAGGICITEQVYDHVQHDAEVMVARLGPKELKNIQTPIEIFKVVLPWGTGLRPSPPQNASPESDAIKSIAVLPFADLSPERDTEYFADGLTDELINALTKLERVRVISRTSVFSLKGKDLDLRTIGEKLKVSTVLEGSVRKAGNKLRITAQLVRVTEDSHLWSETYDRELQDVFSIQEEIAQAIVGKLKINLVGDPSRLLVRRSTENLEAYTLYLKGRYCWNKRTDDGLKKGIEYFEQAIDKDPHYALAYAGLADSYNVMAQYGFLPPNEAYPRAKMAAMKALELDEALAEAHASLADVNLHCGWDWPAAEREYQRAIELNPGCAIAHQWYAEYLTAIGRHDEAITEIKRAQELDPLSLNVSTAVGRVFYFARQYDQAIEEFQKTLEMDPDYFYAHGWLANAYFQKALYDEAIEEFLKTRPFYGDSSEMIAALRAAYTASGMRGYWQMRLNQLKEQAKQRYVPAFGIAPACARLGEVDQALEWLNKGYEECDSGLVYLNVEPSFDNLRSDPRFVALLKKLGLEGGTCHVRD